MSRLLKIGALLLALCGVADAAVHRGVGVKSGASGGGTTIATLTLVNNSVSTVNPAGTFTSVFGWVFKKGDIPTNTFPQFLEAGQSVADECSTGMQSFWSDGSLKFASFLCRTKTAIAASGSLLVSVQSGGAIPCGDTGTGSACANTRTLATDVYPQNISVSAPPATGFTTFNLPTTETSFLCAPGGGCPNNYKQVVWLDGPAGKAWRVSTKMAPSQAGTWEGHLTYDHYVIALTNADGTKGGFRWMGAMRSPFYNGPNAATNTCFAPSSALTMTSVGPGGSGTATVTDPFPFASATWTVTGGQAQTTAANTFSLQNNVNVIPVRFTGSVPTSSPQIDTTHMFLMQASGAQTNNNIDFYAGVSPPGNTGAQHVSFPSSGGSFTVVPSGHLMCPFTRVMFASADAKYIFFQGQGSLASDNTLRVQIDKNYWAGSAVIPPFKLDITGTAFGGQVADFSGASNWTSLNIADLNQYQQNVGDHNDLGPLPYDAAIDFYNQSANSEKMIRTIGLAAALTPFDFKHYATDSTLDTIVNLSATSYTGLGPSNTAVSWCFAHGNFTEPATGANLPVEFSQCDGSHKPQYSFWPLLRTGELQNLDLLLEQGNGAPLSNWDYGRNKVIPGTATTAYGLVSYFYTSDGGGTNEARAAAWTSRDYYIAAGMCPYDPTRPTTYLPLDGSKVCQYLRDGALNDTTYLVATMNPANNYYGSATSYITGAAKRWVPGGPMDPSFPKINYFSNVYGFQTYENWFRMLAWNFAASLLEDANAKTFLGYAYTRWNYAASAYGAWHNYAVADMNGPCCIQAASEGSSVYATDAKYGIKISENTMVGALSWTPGAASSPRFQACNYQNGVTLINGSTWLWSTPGSPVPGGLSIDTTYYVVGISGPSGGCYSFNVSATLGGSGIAISDSGATSGQTSPSATILNPPAANTGFGASFPDAYIQISRAAAAWSQANGVTTTNWYNDADARLAAQGFNYATGGDTLFGSNVFHPQYALAPRFGP